MLFGFYVLYKVALGFARNNETVAPVAWFFVGLYVVFVALTWFAEPISAALLSLHPVGKLALTKRERWAERTLSLTILAGLLLLAASFLGGFESWSVLGFALLVSAAACSTIRAAEPDVQQVQAAYCAFVSVMAVGGAVLIGTFGPESGKSANEQESQMLSIGFLLFGAAVLLGMLVSQVLVSYLNSRVRS